MPYITPPGLIYSKTGNLYLLSTFIHFAPHPPNHQTVLRGPWSLLESRAESNCEQCLQFPLLPLGGAGAGLHANPSVQAAFPKRSPSGYPAGTSSPSSSPGGTRSAGTANSSCTACAPWTGTWAQTRMQQVPHLWTGVGGGGGRAGNAVLTVSKAWPTKTLQRKECRRRQNFTISPH